MTKKPMLEALFVTLRMSQLPHQAIDEFQALWEKHFGEDLPREEAAARAHQTFAVLRMLIEPLPPKNCSPPPDPASSKPTA